MSDLLLAYPNITSAVIHPSASQIRFTCGASTISSGDGVTLVYDYLAKAWSSFQIRDTVHNSTSAPMSTAIVHQGVYKQASALGMLTSGSTGCFLAEDTSGLAGSFTDSGYFVPTTVETGWVSTGDIQGFQRIKRFQVLAQGHDYCNINLNYAIDYGSYHNDVTFAASNANNLSYQVHIGDQKSEAIRIRITDSAPTSAAMTTGEGFTLTRVGLIAGVKSGFEKLAPGYRS